MKTYITIFFQTYIESSTPWPYNKSSPDIATSKEWCDRLPTAKDYDALVTSERRRMRFSSWWMIFFAIFLTIFKESLLNLQRIFLRPYIFWICNKQKTHFFKISRVSLLKLHLLYVYFIVKNKLIMSLFIT